MKLQQLRYFEATCRLGSISRAAESLHVSQPSVSMAIRDLEREFGVSLIARRYQGFSLTEEGTILREMAESLLRHADHVSNRMQALGRQRRPVRLGVPPMIGTTLLPALYRQLAGRYPDLLLATEELGTKTLIRDLRENVLDVAFVSHHAPLPPEFDAVPVTDMEIVWCALPGHPLAGESRISIPQLEDEPLVFFQSNFSLRERVMQQFEDAGVTPPYSPRHRAAVHSPKPDPQRYRHRLFAASSGGHYAGPGSPLPGPSGLCARESRMAPQSKALPGHEPPH